MIQSFISSELYDLWHIDQHIYVSELSDIVWITKVYACMQTACLRGEGYQYAIMQCHCINHFRDWVHTQYPTSPLLGKCNEDYLMLQQLGYTECCLYENDFLRISELPQEMSLSCAYACALANCDDVGQARSVCEAASRIQHNLNLAMSDRRRQWPQCALALLGSEGLQDIMNGNIFPQLAQLSLLAELYKRVALVLVLPSSSEMLAKEISTLCTPCGNGLYRLPSSTEPTAKNVDVFTVKCGFFYTFVPRAEMLMLPPRNDERILMCEIPADWTSMSEVPADVPDDSISLQQFVSQHPHASLPLYNNDQQVSMIKSSAETEAILDHLQTAYDFDFLSIFAPIELAYTATNCSVQFHPAGDTGSLNLFKSKFRLRGRLVYKYVHFRLLTLDTGLGAGSTGLMTGYIVFLNKPVSSTESEKSSPSPELRAQWRNALDKAYHRVIADESVSADTRVACQRYLPASFDKLATGVPAASAIRISAEVWRVFMRHLGAVCSQVLELKDVGLLLIAKGMQTELKVNQLTDVAHIMAKIDQVFPPSNGIQRHVDMAWATAACALDNSEPLTVLMPKSYISKITQGSRTKYFCTHAIPECPGSSSRFTSHPYLVSQITYQAGVERFENGPDKQLPFEQSSALRELYTNGIEAVGAQRLATGAAGHTLPIGGYLDILKAQYAKAVAGLEKERYNYRCRIDNEAMASLEYRLEMHVPITATSTAFGRLVAVGRLMGRSVSSGGVAIVVPSRLYARYAVLVESMYLNVVEAQLKQVLRNITQLSVSAPLSVQVCSLEQLFVIHAAYDIVRCLLVKGDQHKACALIRVSLYQRLKVFVLA